ncbi:MAG: hypothetical protein KJ622_09395 [Alphaproteobacteria bacterium]|nr:hypothetical protein [Alphaproteobacteria bacterium]
MPTFHPGTDRRPPPVPDRSAATDSAPGPSGYAAHDTTGQHEPGAPSHVPRPPHAPLRQPWPLQSAPEHEFDRRTSYAPDHPSAYRKHPRDPESTPARNPTRRASAAGYLMMGFIAGAVFWHAVGFWNLVHDAVFSGPRLLAQDGQPLPVVTAPPADKPPATAAFDEEKLRGSAVRPASAGAIPGPSRITTGSIESPAPVEVVRPSRAAQPRSPAVAPDTQLPSQEPPIMMGPGGISWKPAVSRAR